MVNEEKAQTRMDSSTQLGEQRATAPAAGESTSTVRNDGGPAYPAFLTESTIFGPVTTQLQRGMSLRDYFAGQALAGMLSSDAHPDIELTTLMDSTEKLAVRACFAYRIADAMLAAREAE